MKKTKDNEKLEEYSNFAETLSDDDLMSMKSSQEYPQHLLLEPQRTALIQFRNNKDHYNLYSIISKNTDNSRNFIDRKKLRSLFDQGKTYTESIEKSIGLLFYSEIFEAKRIIIPDHPMVRKKYKKYQKDLSLLKKEIQDLIDEGKYLEYSFGNAKTEHQLTKTQKENRKLLFSKKDIDPKKFNEEMSTGDYYLATFLARLDNAQFEEANLIREEIILKNKVNVPIKDYGLFISEINQGLQISNKINEKYYFKCFVEGNPNLKAIIYLIRNVDKIKEDDRKYIIRVIQALSNDYDCRNYYENESLYKTIFLFIKKYNLPVYQEWKK